MVTIQKMGSGVKRALARLAAVVATAIAAATPAAASTITYYHNDLAGSPVAATNSTAQVVWRESYRPYGERLTKSAASKPNDVWFTSRRQDSTGLVYMGARYYDPVTGRFISTDPKGFDQANIQSFNRYEYANSNPYKYVDPDGKASLAIEGLLVTGLVIYALEPEQTRRRQSQALVDGVKALLTWATSSDNKQSTDDTKQTGKPDENGGQAEQQREPTPATDPDRFDNVRGTKAKRDKETGEIWEKDRLHKDHYEVYDNKKDYDKGKRDRSVWEDGRPKDQF